MITFFLIDQVKWHRIPSLEFLNLALALLIWTVRYPSVFWAASKPFTCIFSLQMASSALDVLLCYAGISVLYKHQIVADPLPMHVSIVAILLYLKSY